jgi:hypothetical protein
MTEQHKKIFMQHVDQLVELYANDKKAELGLSELEYVGHIVSKDGIKVDPKKVEAVHD